MALFEPKPFGKYFLTERIAIGGMAEIYKAKTFGVDGFEKLLAIKKILPHYSADKEFISMLTDEAKLVVRLSHTNIVQIYDLGKVGDDYYISMEFIDGVNMREVINRGKALKDKMPLPVCLYIISEICKGLDYAHSKRDDQGEELNIVHRDVSPQNILISFEGESKIVDFGIAKAAMNISHTTAGILKGKVTYMSPEQTLGKQVDGRTDIFSAGLLLYELVTGERLFTGESQIEVLNKIRSTHITEKSLAGKIPDDIRSLLAKALTYNPKDRYETAGDFQIALTKMLYSQYSDFSPKQLAILIKKWFEAELKVRRKQATQESPSIDTQTKSMMASAQDQKSIVAARESKKEMDKLLQDTTKPEDKITASYFRDQSQTKPERVIRKKSPRINFFTKNRLSIGIAALIVVAFGVGLYKQLIKPPEEVFVEKGQVEITSTPQGADIFVDGEKSGKKTPTNLTGLKIKRDYFIRLQKEGFEPFEKKVFIPTEEPVALAATLKAIPYGSLSVKSKPSGAKILVDGNETGKTTPANFDKLKIGDSYNIKLIKEGYIPFEKSITIADSKPISLETSLEEIILGTIEVESEPRGAKIFLDGKDTGIETPGKVSTLKVPKTYTLLLKKEKYIDVTESIELEGKRPHKTNLKLELMEEFRVGAIRIKTNVRDVSVRINGQKVGNAPGNFEAKAGKIKIQLSKKGYQPTSKTINLDVGDKKELSFKLEQVATPIDIKKPPVDDQLKRPVVGGFGEVRIDSKPRGASVTFDGQKAGITPVVIPKVAAGSKHTLVVSLPNYRKWTKTFTLSRKNVEFMAQMQKE